MADWNKNTHRYEERDSATSTKTGQRADVAGATMQRASTAGGGLGAAARAAKAKPKYPFRPDFKDDASFNSAVKQYHSQMETDTDNVAQKKALSRMR